MPHIHTAPNQHDMTVSAYIVRRVDDEWKCLVHCHRKIEKYMQIGGHIELDQTPWQAMAAELNEESGYELCELVVLQALPSFEKSASNIAHPLPLMMNTHNAGKEHFHSDTCYAFVAEGESHHDVADGESNDLRWLSLDELKTMAQNGNALPDAAHLYEYLLKNIDAMTRVDAASFSLEKPTSTAIEYKRGAPHEQRLEHRGERDR